MRLFVLILCVFLMRCSGTKQHESSSLNWIGVEQIEEKMKEQERPILISLYTDWCGWCKKMDKKVYTNPALISYVKDNFYTVKFNGEYKGPVRFQGKLYSYRADLRVHELAIFLTRGEVGFPATVFMKNWEDQPAPVVGYLEVSDIELLAKFYAEGKGQDWATFQQQFKSTW